MPCFFDNVNHSKLLKQIWTMGIRDKQLLAVIGKMLKAPDGAAHARRRICQSVVACLFDVCALEADGNMNGITVRAKTAKNNAYKIDIKASGQEITFSNRDNSVRERTQAVSGNSRNVK